MAQLTLPQVCEHISEDKYIYIYIYIYSEICLRICGQVN
jgi:hypothetical protein